MDMIHRTSHRQFACAPLYSSGKLNTNIRNIWKANHEAPWRVFEAAADPRSKLSHTSVSCGATVLQTGTSPDILQAPLVAISISGSTVYPAVPVFDQGHTSFVHSTSDDQQPNNYQATPVSGMGDTSRHVAAVPVKNTRNQLHTQAKGKTLKLSKTSMFGWTHTQPSSPALAAPVNLPTPAAPPVASPPENTSPAASLPTAAAPPHAAARTSLPASLSATLSPTSPGRSNSALLKTPPPRSLPALQGPLRPTPEPPTLPPSPDAASSGSRPTTSPQITPSFPTSSSASTAPTSHADLGNSMHRPLSANSSLKAAYENNRKSLFSTAASKQEFYPASSIGFTTPSQLPPCKEWDVREARNASQRSQQQQQWLQQQQQQQHQQPPTSSTHSESQPGAHHGTTQDTPQSNGIHQVAQSTTPPAWFTVQSATTTGAASGVAAEVRSTGSTPPSLPDLLVAQPPSSSPSSDMLSATATHAAVRHISQHRRPWTVPSSSQPRERADPTGRRRVAYTSYSSVDEVKTTSRSSSSTSDDGSDAGNSIPADEAEDEAQVKSSDASNTTGTDTQTTGGKRNSRRNSDGRSAASGSYDPEASSRIDELPSATVGTNNNSAGSTGGSGSSGNVKEPTSSPITSTSTLPTAATSSPSSSASSNQSSSIYRRNGPQVDRPSRVHTTRIHQPCEWDRTMPRPPPPAEESWRRVLVGEYESTSTDHFAEDAGFVRKMLSSRGRVLVIGKSSARGLWHAIRVVRMARSMLLQTESHVPVFQPVILQTEGDRSVQGLPPGCLILYTQKILAGSFPATGPPMWVSQDSDSLAVARAVHTRMAKQHQPVVLECFGPAAGSVAVRAMAAARLLAQSGGRDLCVMVDEGEQVEVADNAYGTALLTRFIIMACAPSQPTYLRNRPSLKFLARRS